MTDLNGSGGYGNGFIVLEGGAVSLMKSADGAYAIGPSTNQAVVMTIGGTPLTDSVLPAGWKITKVLPADSGYDVFAKDPSGLVFNAKFNAAGQYTDGAVVGAAQLQSTEAARGVDLNSDQSLAAASGWTAALKNATIKSSVDTALADGRISYTEAVSLLDAVIQSHKGTGAAISADEVADLQAISARGKAVFGGGSATSTDYLSFVFSKLVDGSVANRFYTGGQLQAAELGNLTVDSPVSQLEKLVDKWLLGGDCPRR